MDKQQTFFVGHAIFRKRILDIANAAREMKIEIPLRHMLLPISEGNGRSTLVRWTAEMLSQSGAHHFPNSEPFLELNIRGGWEALNAAIFEALMSATYTNLFEGIIAIDITDLNEFVEDERYIEVLKKFIHDHTAALFLFFVEERCEHRVEKALNRILKKNIEVFPQEPYTSEDLMAILDHALMNLGVCVEAIVYPEIDGPTDKFGNQWSPVRITQLARDMQMFYLADSTRRKLAFQRFDSPEEANFNLRHEFPYTAPNK